MNIHQLVSAVNAARAREDFIFNRYPGLSSGKPSECISFHFDGKAFRTNLPYRIRLTVGVVIQELNKYCYLDDGNSFRKATFKVDSSGNVTWSV